MSGYPDEYVSPQLGIDPQAPWFVPRTVSRVQQAAGYTAGAMLLLMSIGIYWLVGTFGRASLWWVTLAPAGLLIQIAAMRHIERTWKAR